MKASLGRLGESSVPVPVLTLVGGELVLHKYVVQVTLLLKLLPGLALLREPPATYQLLC